MATKSYGNAAAICPELAFELAIDNAVSEMQCVIPGRIVAYDRESHKAIVEPLVRKNTPLEFSDMPLVHCTVHRMFCGRYLIDVPLAPYDTGWIIACDSDSSLVKQYRVHNSEADEKGEWQCDPNTNRTHKYEFGFFIPDRWGKTYNTDNDHKALFAEGEEDEERLVIQSSDGTQKVSILHPTAKDKGEIKITSAVSGTESTVITIKNGVITINSSTKIDVTTPEVAVHSPKVTYDQATNFTIDGTLHVTGNISTDADVIPGNTFTLQNHKHNGDGGPAVGITSAPISN